MSAAVFFFLAIAGAVVRLMIWRAREREARQLEERSRASAGEDPALAHLIQACETRAAAEADPRGDRGFVYRAKAAPAALARPRAARSGPVEDEVASRCERCDMRVGRGERYCASCGAIVAARASEPRATRPKP